MVKMPTDRDTVLMLTSLDDERWHTIGKLRDRAIDLENEQLIEGWKYLLDRKKWPRDRMYMEARERYDWAFERSPMDKLRLSYELPLCLIGGPLPDVPADYWARRDRGEEIPKRKRPGKKFMRQTEGYATIALAMYAAAVGVGKYIVRYGIDALKTDQWVK